MRDTSLWHPPLVRRLRPWPPEAPLAPAEACRVELGLYLLEHLVPDAAPEALWALLAGHEGLAPQVDGWTEEERRRLGNARHLLPYYRSERPWRAALDAYGGLDDRLRLYDVGPRVARRVVSLAADRAEAYGRALDGPVPFVKRAVRWAGAGTHAVAVGADRPLVEVEVPPELALPRPVGHALGAPAERAPLEPSGPSWTRRRAGWTPQKPSVAGRG